MTSRLVVLATGSGSNLQAILDACTDGTLEAKVVLVVVNRRTAYAAERAAAAGVPSVYRPMGPFREAVPDDPRRARERYDAALAAEIADARPDLIVQAGWMHLFTSAFLDRFPGMVVNLHPALPGAFPGAHAIDDAWAAHETDGLDHTGVMVHLVPDEGVDDGPVLASQRVPIMVDDTRETLEARLHEVEHELFVATIGDYLRTR
ncbi:MAG: phosphoribosylglycinamide formyltransferase [Actinobacteria bacterium]|nr:phosphoribosylglycinamide formyltransferase [Actinomycetota bacterium]NDH75649.1 phosphoribosylglycinamide formyltransferase [Actinomycetota bacterium]